MPLALQAGLWGLVSGSASPIGALAGWLLPMPRRLVDSIMASARER